MPVGAPSFREALRMEAEIFHTLKNRCTMPATNANVGDEGGFAPNLKSPDEALTFIAKAVEKAGVQIGRGGASSRSDPGFHRIFQERQV